MKQFLGALLGTILGTVLYLYLANFLDVKFRPFPTDMPVWIFYAIPTGIFFGGASGLSVSCQTFWDRLIVGTWCIFLSIAFGSIYIYFLNSDMLEYHNVKYALSASGPALIWAAVLLVRGVWLARKGLSEKSG